MERFQRATTRFILTRPGTGGRVGLGLYARGFVCFFFILRVIKEPRTTKTANNSIEFNTFSRTMRVDARFFFFAKVTLFCYIYIYTHTYIHKHVHAPYQTAADIGQCHDLARKDNDVSSTYRGAVPRTDRTNAIIFLL